AHGARIHAAPVPILWRKSRGGRMTASGEAAGAYAVGRKTLSAVCVVSLLTMLAACAGESATSGPATSAAPTAAAAVAAPAARPARGGAERRAAPPAGRRKYSPEGKQTSSAG